MLTSAINNCILGETGPHKNLLMNNLLKDERAKKLNNYEILEIM